MPFHLPVLFKASSLANVQECTVASLPNGRSKGFAMVSVASEEDANTLIAAFNGRELQGRELEVRFDQKPIRDSEPLSPLPPVDVDAIKSKSLYVGNVPYSVGWQDLKDLFRGAGNPIRADIPSDYNHRSRGFGIVVMSSVDEAKKAAQLYHGYEWHGRRLEVREDRSYQDSPSSVSFDCLISKKPTRKNHSPDKQMGGNGESRLLFVGNLPYSVDWKDLKDLFNEIGDVVRADIATSDNGQSKGYGQVLMATEQDAAEAIEQLNGTELKGREIEVRYDRRAGEKSSAVYIGNLPYSAEEQGLKDLFHDLGLYPVNIEILYDSNSNRAKGAAVAQFKSIDEAEEAVARVNGHNFEGRQLFVKLDKFGGK